MPLTTTLSLACHPQTPSAAVGGVEVRVRRSAPDALALTFAVEGDLARIRVPSPRAPRFAHQLWEHTCFEVFLAAEGTTIYHELNLAPSGEWAGYRFRDYREVEALVDDALAPSIATVTIGDRLVVNTLVEVRHLSPDYPSVRLRLGFSAVIEETDGRHSYWALHHPSGQPDFHHRDTRALLLEPVQREW